jgi:hypothetical protein
MKFMMVKKYNGYEIGIWFFKDTVKGISQEQLWLSNFSKRRNPKRRFTCPT